MSLYQGLGSLAHASGDSTTGIPNPSAPDPLLSAAYGLNDAQLAEVLNGKPLSIMVGGKPVAITPAMAMMAAMGKKELRTAVEGKLAQQQLMQQQSMKDKMLADLTQPQGQMPPQGIQQAAMAPQAAPQGPAMEHGLPQLPAENMKSMAGGGIVAFGDPKLNPNEDQVVELSDEERAEYIKNNPAMQRSIAAANLPSTILSGIKKYNPITGTAYRDAIQNFMNESPEDQYKNSWEKSKQLRQGIIKQDGTLTPKGKLVEQGLVDPETPITKLKEEVAKNVALKADPNVYDREDAEAGAAFKNNTKNNNTKNNTAKDNGGAPPAPNPYAKPPTRENPYARFADMSIDSDKVKEQGLGGALMALSQGLLSGRNLAEGVQKGLPGALQQAMSTSKEIRDLEKEKRAYDFTLARANEAFAEGQEKLGFEYLKQAQTHDYQMKHLGVLAQNNPMAMISAIRKENPGMSITDAISALSSAKNDYKGDLALQQQFSKWKTSTAGLLEPNTTFEQWKQKMGYDTAGGNSPFTTVIPA